MSCESPFRSSVAIDEVHRRCALETNKKNVSRCWFERIELTRWGRLTFVSSGKKRCRCPWDARQAYRDWFSLGTNDWVHSSVSPCSGTSNMNTFLFWQHTTHSPTVSFFRSNRPIAELWLIVMAPLDISFVVCHERTIEEEVSSILL